MNPDRRTNRDGVPIALHDEPDAVTAATEEGHRIALSLGLDGTASPELAERRVDTLLDAARERVAERTGTATAPSATVRVPRRTLATLADEANVAADGASDDEVRREVERAYRSLGYEGPVSVE